MVLGVPIQIRLAHKILSTFQLSLFRVVLRARLFKTNNIVNVSLKFQTLISEICQYFLLENCEKLLHCKSFFIFSAKNFSVFGYKGVKHLTS